MCLPEHGCLEVVHSTHFSILLPPLSRRKSNHCLDASGCTRARCYLRVMSSFSMSVRGKVSWTVVPRAPEGFECENLEHHLGVVSCLARPTCRQVIRVAMS